jgi:hypothetical protein
MEYTDEGIPSFDTDGCCTIAADCDDSLLAKDRPTNALDRISLEEDILLTSDATEVKA